MTLRILKLIFLFIVLSPVQDQFVCDIPEQDKSDNKESDAGSCFMAAMQESSHLVRSGRLSYRKVADNKSQKESLDFAACIHENTIAIEKNGMAISSISKLSGNPIIAFGLLRHCYQSKSSNCLPDQASIA